MRKILLLLIVLISAVASAQTDYYANACNSTDIASCTWNTTSTGSCTASGGTALVYANRVANSAFHTNGCPNITIAANPGVSGNPVILTNSASALAGGTTGTGGGYFALTASITATVSVTAGAVAPTGNGALQISGSPTATVGCATCIFQGGTIANAMAIEDTHTTSTVTAIGYAKGGTASSTTGYDFNSTSGTVNGDALNAQAGTAGAGVKLLNSTGTQSMSIKNCINNDGLGAGGQACVAGSASSSPAIVWKGSAVAGTFSIAIFSGKVFPTPSSAQQAIYLGTNTSSYLSTQIVDANGNILSSPTLTNAHVFSVDYASTGIGNTANVVNGVQYGPFTGTAATGGGNSSSSH